MAIDNAYDDGYAFVHEVLTRHGGVPGLKRLAAAFRRTGDGDLSPAQVNHVFQKALGVPFSQVVAEAHQFASSSG